MKIHEWRLHSATPCQGTFGTWRIGPNNGSCLNTRAAQSMISESSSTGLVRREKVRWWQREPRCTNRPKQKYVCGHLRLSSKRQNSTGIADGLRLTWFRESRLYFNVSSIKFARKKLCLLPPWPHKVFHTRGCLAHDVWRISRNFGDVWSKNKLFNMLQLALRVSWTSQQTVQRHN